MLSVASAAELELESLLSQPLYDTVEDPDQWGSLFEAVPAVPAAQPVTVSPVPAVEPERRESAKRSLASILDEVDVSPVFTSKRLKAEPTPSVSPVPTAASDPKAERRARNTLAARRSRDRKRERMSELEARVAELEQLNTQLSIENQMLRQYTSMPPRGASRATAPRS